MNNQISFLYNQDGRTNFTQISAESNLDDVCQAFEDFLRGSGFHFDGRVEIVDDVRVHGDNAPISIELFEKNCLTCGSKDRHNYYAPCYHKCHQASLWEPRA